MAGAFAIGALSVAGVPPAAGFVGKLEMFRAGIVAGSVPLVVLLLAGSALSLVYMFQVYQRRFWREDPSAQGPVRFQNSATVADLRFQAARSYSLISPPSTGRRLIRSWSRSGVG